MPTQKVLKAGTHRKRQVLQQAGIRDKKRCVQRKDACKALTHLHVWQVEGEIGWLSYPTAVALRLEEEHEHMARGTVDFTLSSNEYVVDLASMMQTRLSTGMRRQVRRVQLDDLEPSSQGESLLQRSYIEARKALCAAQEELESERSAKSTLEAEVGRLNMQLLLLGLDKADMERRLSALQCEVRELRDCVEGCRQSPYSGAGSWTVAEQSLHSVLADLLKSTSHGVLAGSRCNGIHAAQVRAVESIYNPALWDKYMRSRRAMSDCHAKHGVRPGFLPLAAHGLDWAPFPWMSLSKELNEALLWHGCCAETAKLIREEGFDPRASNTECLYGEGTYFTSQACKAWQYARPDNLGWRCMLLCRVTLGDLEFVRTPQKGKKRPSLRDSADRQKGTFDSFVVNPCDMGGPAGQAHQEFVIFKPEQAYPELIVWFLT